MPVHIARTVAANLLRRAGLTRDAVAIDCRLMPAARRDDLLQETDERLIRRAV